MQIVDKASVALSSHLHTVQRQETRKDFNLSLSPERPVYEREGLRRTEPADQAKVTETPHNKRAFNPNGSRINFVA